MRNNLIDVYCDESCHLLHDGEDVMVLGAVAVPHDQRLEIADQIRGLKQDHGLSRSFEVKWTKVSPGQLTFYEALVDFFFDNPDLEFRGLVAHQKSALRHEDFGQDHDTWYHKMYWEMLRVVISPRARYRIYIDIKDTRGGAKARTLYEVLSNTYHDWNHDIVERIQIVRSHELEILQVADLMVGALGYASRGRSTSAAKMAVIRRIEERSGHSLARSTTLGAPKFNIFHWHPQAAKR